MVTTGRVFTTDAAGCWDIDADCAPPSLMLAALNATAAPQQEPLSFFAVKPLMSNGRPPIRKEGLSPLLLSIKEKLFAVKTMLHHGGNCL